MRFSKPIALQLIPFVKRVEIRANYWDPQSTSAFEFARQMMSTKLKKVNPTLHVELFRHDTEDEACISVEFANGSKWETKTSLINAVDLRNEVYKRAEDVEDSMEEEDPEGINLRCKLLMNHFHQFLLIFISNNHLLHL